MTITKRAATLAATTLLTLPVIAADGRLEEQLRAVSPVAHHTEEEEGILIEPSKTPATTTVTRWVGTNFTATETEVLNFLQDRGITDRTALATILGNIKQESLFETNICEGGARTGYHGCHSGGFGLIQWTTTGRYNGLGNFAAKYGGDPNQLNTQLRYMVNENQWVSNEHVWKTPGLSINQHMNAAYRWLGWGIHGNRTTYAHQYYDALTQVEVEVPGDT